MIFGGDEGLLTEKNGAMRQGYSQEHVPNTVTFCYFPAENPWPETQHIERNGLANSCHYGFAAE